MLFAGALCALSLVLNLVFINKYRTRFISPLDNYQELKQYPLVNTTLVRSNMTLLSKPSENAVVTTLYSDSYAPAVAALGHSLRKVDTLARLILLYIPSQVSASALCLASSSGFVPHPVQRIAPPHNGSGVTPRFLDQYTKLTLWTLDRLPEPVRALVYIDADALALRNFDELFALPYAFAAVPDVYGDVRGFTTNFNAGVMFLRPDSALFAAMLDAFPAARYPRTMAEQAFLNQYFATDALRLPYAYNGNLALKSRSPHVWSGVRSEMRIIHYTLVKPFITKKWDTVPLDRMQERVDEAARSYSGLFRDEMEYWGRVWVETRTVYAQQLDECRGLRSFNKYGF
ncbi:glycosyltransferase family 8 protein [Phanerochaete carnosa HHB-10118-sp]|uniref:Glycosyltransferase family 8 protein n=1 Tax=Phanerochaete carnosa (strain HHB-10118-sp) TaxID=650164 RepID=K5WC85_PHACS|nr:glycosyltransferase family 8 protein [Phanerochaete carnosa HHB-10118-sp]EKM56619.1 glycosyltransferase family 8 protein [Phanerochaete carnosa HHB-10118-sp]